MPRYSYKAFSRNFWAAWECACFEGVRIYDRLLQERWEDGNKGNIPSSIHWHQRSQFASRVNVLIREVIFLMNWHLAVLVSSFRVSSYWAGQPFFEQNISGSFTFCSLLSSWIFKSVINILFSSRWKEYLTCF